MKKTEAKGIFSESDELRLFLLVIIFAVGYKAIKRVNQLNLDSVHIASGFLVFIIIAASIRKWKAIATLLAKIFKRNADNGSSTLIAKTFSGVDIEVPDSVRLGHVQILGATGRGKSMSVLKPLAVRDIRNGKNVIIIDGKGDLSLAKDVIECTKEANVKVQVFDFAVQKDQFRYNPLGFGDIHQVVDKLLSVFDFENSYYRSVQKEWLLLVCRTLKKSGRKLNFRDLYECLTSDNRLIEISDLTNDLKLKSDIQNLLREKKDSRVQKLSGLTSQLSDFVSESISFHFDDSEDDSQINLADVMLNQNESESCHFIYFSLPTLKYQKTAKIFGKLLLQDLAGIIGERENCPEKKYTSVFLDEFSAIAYEDFYQILNKARSAKVALHLSHQSLGDLKIVSEDFAEIVTTNTNVKCILGINDPETADYFARLFGTKTSTKLTERMSSGSLWGREKTGDGSVRDVEIYKIHPNKMKSYVNGRGVLHFVDELGPVTEEVQFLPILAKEGR